MQKSPNGGGSTSAIYTMKPETRNCQNCRIDFVIEPEDFEFYDNMGVQAPSLCPSCRAQKRLMFRNERVFYKRNCDKCAKSIVSMYSANKQYPVWCHDCYFSESWDPMEFGVAYDSTRSFFEQVRELWDKVPKVALLQTNPVNSEYTNFCADVKNCYLVTQSSNCEDCSYGHWIQKCKDGVDLSFSHETELSYESDDCYNSSKLFYSKGCDSCLESYFLYDSRGCSNCIGCINLRNKQYYIFNQPYSKAEYEKFLSDARLDTREGVEALREKAREFILTQPRKFAEIYNAPDSTGNYIKNAKNCRDSFHAYDAEDCRYAVHAFRGAKDCMDIDACGRSAERVYNSFGGSLNASNIISSVRCIGSTYTEYSAHCLNANYNLGCVSLRKKDYCILNTQYKKEEYLTIREQIIDKLKKQDTWGNFFPAPLSPFGYNETSAQEEFPLSQDETLAKGYLWEDTPRGAYGKENGKDILACGKCQKNYRLIPSELEFYKNLSIPLPDLCPDCRQERRLSARGPNRLWQRQCMKEGCANEFETSYAPERSEIIYCETHYNAEVV